MMRLLLSVLAVLLLAGCADPVTEPTAAAPDVGSDLEASEGPTADPGAPDETPPPDPMPDPEGVPQPATCSDPVAIAVGDRIDAQLEAFAQGDFPAALTHASPGFQAGTDAETFRQLIERDFALLLRDASAEVEGCAQLREDVSDVVVVIATADGARTRFVYRLRLVDERWGIEAARRLDPPAAEA